MGILQFSIRGLIAGMAAMLVISTTTNAQDAVETRSTNIALPNAMSGTVVIDEQLPSWSRTKTTTGQVWIPQFNPVGPNGERRDLQEVEVNIVGTGVTWSDWDITIHNEIVDGGNSLFCNGNYGFTGSIRVYNHTLGVPAGTTSPMDVDGDDFATQNSSYSDDGRVSGASADNDGLTIISPSVVAKYVGDDEVPFYTEFNLEAGGVVYALSDNQASLSFNHGGLFVGQVLVEYHFTVE